MVLLAGAVLACARLETADRAEAADGTRERAEDLARAASQRFSEVMKDGGKRPAASPVGQSGGDDPWAAALKWLERSNHDYKSIVRRLSQRGAPANAQTTPPPNATASIST